MHHYIFSSISLATALVSFDEDAIHEATFSYESGTKSDTITLVGINFVFLIPRLLSLCPRFYIRKRTRPTMKCRKVQHWSWIRQVR